MGSTSAPLTGIAFDKGAAFVDLKKNTLTLGHAFGEAVIVVRRGQQAFAVGASCTHYGGPLAEGALVGDGIRCPWHHACFNLHTGEVERAPALNAIACWKVEVRGDRFFVTGKKASAPKTAPRKMPATIAIVGGGAAASAAAERLRSEGFTGTLTLFSADSAVPCDRPNLSKDYLAGTAPEEIVAVATVGRDALSLAAEAAMEKQDNEALEILFR